MLYLISVARKGSLHDQQKTPYAEDSLIDSMKVLFKGTEPISI